MAEEQDEVIYLADDGDICYGSWIIIHRNGGTNPKYLVAKYDHYTTNKHTPLVKGGFINW